jgi:hypothetical protein
MLKMAFIRPIGAAMALNLWILANNRVGKRRVKVVKYLKITMLRLLPTLPGCMASI